MNGKRKMLSTLRNTIVSSLEPTSNKKENQMIDPIAAARSSYDNADEAFRLNPSEDNLATYEATREALVLTEAEAGLSSNAAIDDEEDEDERPFPDSDEAIRALQDVAEAVDEMEIEIARLRAELKTALAERDAARRVICEVYTEDLGELKDLHEWEEREAKRRGWDCYKKEESK